jgi:hypothetical protein
MLDAFDASPEELGQAALAGAQSKPAHVRHG